MFILKREDVQILNVKHPEQDQKIVILKYNNQTFRLIKLFPAEKHEEAVSLWRDLADNQHRFCILLEEKERYSVWGKVKVSSEVEIKSNNTEIIPLIQACLLLLQTIYWDIEDLFGTRQSDRFIQDMTKFFQTGNFPETNSQKRLQHLLRINPLEDLALPPWEEHHLVIILQELYRLSKQYFGNTNFAEDIQEIIKDLPINDQQLFINWLNNNSLDKLWKSN